MNKQEQIEEMEKIIDELYNVYDTTAGEIAEGLYNTGYRKIPENAVVLTKEEYIDLSRNYVGEQIEKTRKETAKEIVEKVKGQSETFLIGYGDGQYDEHKYVSVEYIEELAKQFGLEVEE